MIYPAGLQDKFDFGKFKGRTVQQVCDEQPSYIDWCDDNVSGFDLTQEAWDYHTDSDTSTGSFDSCGGDMMSGTSDYRDEYLGEDSSFGY